MKLTATLILLLGTTFTLHAQTFYTFTGEGGSGNWNLASNWDPQGVPGPGDVAFIPDRPPNRIFDVWLTSNVTVGKLIVGRDNTFSLNSYRLTLQQGGSMAEGSRLQFGSNSEVIVAADSFVVRGEVLLSNGGRIAGTGLFINRGRLYTPPGQNATIAGQLINYGTVEVFSNTNWYFASGGSYTNYGSTTINQITNVFWYVSSSNQPLSTIRNQGRLHVNASRDYGWSIGQYNPGLLRLQLISDTLSISGNGAINIYSQALLQGQPVFRVDSLSAVYFRGTTIIADSVQALVHGSGFLGQWGGLLTSADSTQGAVLNVQGSGFGLGNGARLAGRLLNRGRLYTPPGQNATIAGQLINYGTVEVFSNTNWYFASGGSYTNYGSTTINPNVFWYVSSSNQPLSTIRNQGRLHVNASRDYGWSIGQYNPGLLRLELISDTLSISGNGAINIYSQALLQGQPVFRVDSLSAVYFRGTTIIADSVQALVHGSGFLGQWGGLLTSADSTQGAVLNVQGSGFGLGNGARLAGRLLNRGRLYTPPGQNATIAGQLINYGTVEVFSNTNWYFASGGSYTNYGSTTINPNVFWYVSSSDQPLSTIRNQGRLHVNASRDYGWSIGQYNPGLLRLELISDTLSISGNGAINIYSQALLQGQPVFRVDSLSAVYFRGTTIIADSVQALVHGSGFLGQWGGLLTSADSTQGAVLNVQGSGFGLGNGARLAGRLLNRGTMYAPSGHTVYLTGSLINQGTLVLNTLFVTGTTRRTLYLGNNSRATIRITDRFALIGQNYLPNFQIESNGLIIVQDTLELGSGPFSGIERMLIPGVVKSRLFQATATFIMPGLRLEGVSGVDSTRSLQLTYHGLSTPESFANAVPGWWRFTLADTTVTPVAQRLVLRYNESYLQGIPEDSLFVFYSPDGVNWQLFSGSLTRDAAANTFTLQQAPLRGFYAIASARSSPIEAVPALYVEMLGRRTLRIGAPNRYTIFYTNLGRTSTGPIFIRINYDPDAMRLDYVELKRITDDAPIRLPADSVLVEPGLIVLLGRHLNFTETASFDLVFTGLPGALGKQSAYPKPQAVPVLVIAAWAAPRIAAWVASGLVFGYLEELAENFLCDEIWAPVSPDANVRKELSKAFVRAFEKTNKEWFSIQKVQKELQNNLKDEAAQKVQERVIPEFVLDLISGPVKIATFVSKSLECLFRGANRYTCDVDRNRESNKISLNVPPDLQSELPEIAGATSQTQCGPQLNYELQPVRSWDPNEKAGPAGIGAENYLNQAGRLHYTIFFENLATATAPAYRIVIVDTLSSILDPETVEFGTTSHKGWQITRQGNILRWEIEGIELPPNVNPPEGEGFVTFSVLPRQGAVVDGTRIENRATIVFDLNPPIMTNTVVNVFDLSAPTVTLLPLPEEIDRDTLVLRWQAQDAGSGVAFVSIYRSTDGGPFELIARVGSERDSIEVPVERGHRYAFYAIGQDFVGNTMQQRSNEVSTNVLIVNKEETETTLPERFVLDAIYPNPFRTQVTFRIGLPKQNLVRLVVYDLLGREVARIVDGELPAGWHELRWQEPTLASGLYLVRFEAEKTHQVRTFLKVH
jgi:hypothetical protein